MSHIEQFVEPTNAAVIFKLGQIEAKLDGYALAVNKHIDDDKRVEERVRRLENNGARYGGIAAVISLFATAAINILWRAGFHA